MRQRLPLMSVRGRPRREEPLLQGPSLACHPGDLIGRGSTFPPQPTHMLASFLPHSWPTPPTYTRTSRTLSSDRTWKGTRSSSNRSSLG